VGPTLPPVLAAPSNGYSKGVVGCRVWFENLLQILIFHKFIPNFLFFKNKIKIRFENLKGFQNKK